MDEKDPKHFEEDYLLASSHFRQIDHGKRVRTLHFSGLYLIIMAQFVILWHFLSTATKDPSQLVYSPAMETIEYEVVDFGINHNEYMPKTGPNNHSDELWANLYTVAPGIPKWQADRLENKTLRLPESETYLVDLDVFHQLHCLNMLRKALYPDRYGNWEWTADGKVNTKTAMFSHWEHCVDQLRQTLVCHGDIHPLRYRVNEKNGKLAPDIATRHTCRNFEKIREWAKERDTKSDHIQHSLV